MLHIYQQILPARGEEALVWLTLLIVALFVFMAVFDAIRHLFFVQLSAQLEDRFSRKTFTESLKKRAATSAPDQHRALQDVDQIRTLLTKGHLLHFFDIIWFPAFAVAIALFHPLLALVAIAGAIWLGLIAVINHTTIGPSVEDARRDAISALTVADEMIAKAEVAKSLGMMPSMIHRWYKLRRQSVESHLAVSNRLAIVSAVSKTSRLLIQSLTLGLGAYLAINDAVSAGAIVAASILVGRALSPIEASVSAWQEFIKARNAYWRLAKFMSSTESDNHPIIMANCQGLLSVENLSCAYANHQIFDNVSFEALPGQMIAIIGPSGSGKSTLARHLVGIKRATKGFVRLDGVDLFMLPDEARSRHIGYVPQESHLFDGTVVDCIGRFGSSVAEDILATALIADIHNMVLRLPEGYGTRIGLDGCKLSGGQRQRLALARALYGEPSLVVLDEPCTHLDEVGERALIRTISELKGRGVTLCVVTHKTNLIRQADLLLVLNTKGESCVRRPEDIFAPRLRTVPTGQQAVASL